MGALKTIIDNNISCDVNAVYKFHSPGVSEHAGYFTIVGSPTPSAFFLNSKDMQSFQWITALMTAYSRQLEYGRPVADLITDMKNTFQPGGSYFVPGTGKEVNSVVHHLGVILEKHMAGISPA